MDGDIIFQEVGETFLSNNEEFGKITKTLGSGYNGTAFLTDKNLVVKITRDEQEFQTALEVSNKLNGVYTPKYYKVEKYDGLYIIVMDLVEPIKLSKKESEFLNMFRDGLLTMIEQGVDTTHLKKSIKKIGNDKLEFVLDGLVVAVVGLNKMGILNDDIQEDNIGILNGKIVLFDIVNKEHQLAENTTKVRLLIREVVESFFL